MKKNTTGPWRDRVQSGDWEATAAEVNEYGGALLPQLLSPERSRGTATLLPHSHGYLLATRDRPGESAHGWSAAPVRHGASAIRSDERHPLGLVFHDAA